MDPFYSRLIITCLKETFSLCLSVIIEFSPGEAVFCLINKQYSLKVRSVKGVVISQSVLFIYPGKKRLRRHGKKVSTIKVTDLQRSVWASTPKGWLYAQLKKPKDIKQEREEWETAFTALHLLLISRPTGVGGHRLCMVQHLGPIPLRWVKKIK